MPGARFVIRLVRHDQDAPSALQVKPGQPVSSSRLGNLHRLAERC